MKGILSENRWAVLKLPGLDDACASDQILTEVDTGGATNGEIILTIDVAADSDMRNIQFWTSMRSDFATDGTALAAIASDGLALCVIASDADSLYAKGVVNGSISDLTVSSNAISSIDQDGTYVIRVKNLGRYLNMQYDSMGVGSYISAVFIGHDLPEVPYGGAQAAY